MTTQLYVFSGTGNSLSVARSIKAKLQNSELISIPKVKQNTAISADVIGIISPIYMHFMPHIVADLIKRIKHADYIFFVYTGAGELGNGIGKTQKLFKKQGHKLSALFNVIMPGNYIPNGCPSEKHQKEVLSKVENRVNEIVTIISDRGEHIDSNNTTFMAANVHPGLLYKLGYAMINTMDRSFTIDKNCNSCSICQQVCPVNNIAIKEGRPEWHNNCQQCFACLQWCPKEAIQYRNLTSGENRYHHPEVKVTDIIAMAKK